MGDHGFEVFDTVRPALGYGCVYNPCIRVPAILLGPGVCAVIEFILFSRTEYNDPYIIDYRYPSFVTSFYYCYYDSCFDFPIITPTLDTRRQSSNKYYINNGFLSNNIGSCSLDPK